MMIKPLAEQVAEGLERCRDAREAIRCVVDLVHAASPRHDWTGVYLMDGAEDLVLDYFIGAPSPHTRISLDSGICGAAAREKQTVVVDDVHSDPRYLACSLATKSEIVVPIMRDGRVLGEIDIDSHTPAAFDATERRVLEQVAALLAARLEPAPAPAAGRVT
jgi:L-methionine (R)-S-oxide reductase